MTAIAEALDRPTPAVSQHLAKLRAGHLVTARREGTTIYYSQANEHVSALVTNVLQHTEHTLYPAAAPPLSQRRFSTRTTSRHWSASGP